MTFLSIQYDKGPVINIVKVVWTEKTVLIKSTNCVPYPPTGIDKDHCQQFYLVLIPTSRKLLVYRTNKPINQLLSTP